MLGAIQVVGATYIFHEVREVYYAIVRNFETQRFLQEDDRLSNFSIRMHVRHYAVVPYIGGDWNYASLSESTFKQGNI